MEADHASAGVTSNGLVEKKPCMSSSLRTILTPWAWFQPQLLDPRVAALIYWRNVQSSAAVLSVTLSILIALSFCSLISVISYFSLLTLAAAFAFRIYASVRQAINKTQDGHPFQDFMSMDLSLSADKVHTAADCFISQFNLTVAYLQRVFLIQDIVESIKFGAYLYALTYVGGWMNGLTIMVLFVVAMFSLPKAYEVNKAQCDQYLALFNQQVAQVVTKVKAVLPIGGGAAGAAKDKEQ